MRVKEVVDITGVSRDTLRYYENIGLIRDVKRNANGFREYTDRDIRWIEFIKKLKLTKMPLESMLIYAEARYSEDPDVQVRIDVLKKHKEKILNELKEYNEALDYIDYKINYYEDHKDKWK